MFDPFSSGLVSLVQRPFQFLTGEVPGVAQNPEILSVPGVKSLELGHGKVIGIWQSRLENFYAGFGFAIVGERYMEDGIPHTEMLRPPAR